MYLYCYNTKIMSKTIPHLTELPPDFVRGAEVLATNSARALLFLATMDGQPRTGNDQGDLLNNAQGDVPGWFLEGSEMATHSVALVHGGVFAQSAGSKKYGNSTVAVYYPKSESDSYVPVAGSFLDGELANPGPYRDLLVDPRPSYGKPGATSAAWSIYDELLRRPPFTLSPAQLMKVISASPTIVTRTIVSLEAKGCLQIYDRTDITRRTVELRQPTAQCFRGDPLLPAFALATTSGQLLEQGIERLSIEELIRAVLSNPAHAHLNEWQVRAAIMQQPRSLRLPDLNERGDAENRRRATVAITPQKLEAVEELVTRLRRLCTPAGQQKARKRAKEIMGNSADVAYLMAKARGEAAVESLLRDCQDAAVRAKTNGPVIAYSRQQRIEFELAASAARQQKQGRIALLGAAA
jgi:hypothetical protein